MAGKDNEQRRSISFHLNNKMEKLQKQLDELNAEYDREPTVTLWMRINLVEYHIECTKNRMNGDFIDNRVDYGVRSTSPLIKTAI